MIAEDDHYTLLIYEVQPDDAGKYDCTLSNKHGRTASSATLSVLGTPLSVDLPTLYFALAFFTRWAHSMGP